MSEEACIKDLEDVKFFLQQLRQFLSDDTCQLDIQRDRRGQDQSDPNTTVNTMLDLDYNSENVKGELLSLQPEDYIKTAKDRNRQGSPDYWIFSKKIGGRDIYMKLKICSLNRIHLMSFHYAVFEIEDQPYK